MNFLLQDKAKLIRLSYAVLAFLVAIISDLIFWNKANGLGAFLVVAIYLVGFTYLAHLYNHIHNRLALLLLIPITILSFNQILFNNILVKTAVPFSIFILAILYSILLTLKNNNKYIFYFKNIPIIKNALVVLKKLATIVSDLLSWTRGAEHNEKYKQIAIGLVISLPIIFVFTMLFAEADKVFGDGLEKLVSWRIDLDFEIFWRVLKVVIYGFLVGSFFYTLIDEKHTLLDTPRSVKKISITISTVVLTLTNILFAIFVFIQIKYLFGTHDFVINQGIVFAEYARSGFFQLAWVMVFSAILILVFYRSSWHHGQDVFANILKLILIVQIFIIGISALKRMNLYQNEYGYTTLRLYVEWFIYFASLIFALLAIAIFKHCSFKKAFYVGLICGLTAFTIISAINVDRIIARKNIARYLTQNKTLDLQYLLNTLSVDTIPEIIFLKQNTFDSSRINFQYNESFDYLLSVSDKNYKNKYINTWLSSELNKKKLEITADHESWYTFNLGAQNALNSLNK